MGQKIIQPDFQPVLEVPGDPAQLLLAFRDHPVQGAPVRDPVRLPRILSFLGSSVPDIRIPAPDSETSHDEDGGQIPDPGPIFPVLDFPGRPEGKLVLSGEQTRERLRGLLEPENRLVEGGIPLRGVREEDCGDHDVDDIFSESFDLDSSVHGDPGSGNDSDIDN